MNIDTNLSVGALKGVIALKKKLQFPARELRLYLTKRGDAWLKNDDDTAIQLEEGFVTGDIEVVLNDEKMKIHVLVELQKTTSVKHHEARSTVLEYSFPTGSILNCINPDTPYLDRASLLQDVYETISMKNNGFVLFSLPPASEKTSLLKLFAISFDHLCYFYVSCLGLKGRPCCNVVEELANKARNKRVDIIVLDDAQEVYDQSDFWIQLVKKTSLMVSDGVKFIISATQISERANLREIKKAYRTLDRELHPDKNLDKLYFISRSCIVCRDYLGGEAY